MLCHKWAVLDGRPLTLSSKWAPMLQKWLKRPIKIMMGIGTPSNKSRIERILKPPFIKYIR